MAEWRDLVGYEGVYKISSDGEIYSVPRFNTKGGLMKLHLHKTGYLYTLICKDGKQKNVNVHREVAKAFIPRPNNKTEVNHKNGIKTDNRVENLEWVTGKENIKHAYKTGLKKASIGKVPVVVIRQDNGERTIYESIRSAARHLELNPNAVSKALERGRKIGIYRFYRKEI